MKKFLVILMVVAMASFLFVGCNGVTPPVNTAPVIATIPDAAVTAGDAFTYAVVATDPDVGDVLTYSLTVAPEDMLIDADSGVITWPITTEGTFGVIVVVTDEGGLTDSEGFTITVSAVEPEPNQAPVITSTAITSGKVGEEYIYNVVATDPDEDDLTYSLTEKPLGMAIVAATGAISWDPTDAGVFGVGVKVSDPDELFDVQDFSITVAEADEPEPEPELVLVGITVDPNTMDLIVGEEETIESVTATYELKGYEVDIALGDCLFLTSDSEVATVEVVVNVVTVTAVAEGTADIVVSYEGKIDTLEVTVNPVELDYILVYPETMGFAVSGVVGTFPFTVLPVDDTIDLVVAYYNDGTHPNVDLADCDFSYNEGDITVTVAGVVTVATEYLDVLEDLTDPYTTTFDTTIIVNYGGKTDTIEVEVEVEVL